MIVFDLKQYPPSMSCSQHCRHLISVGHDPQTPIKFVRGSIPVFNEVFTLEYWATRECIESRDGAWMRWQSNSSKHLQVGPVQSRNKEEVLHA